MMVMVVCKSCNGKSRIQPRAARVLADVPHVNAVFCITCISYLGVRGQVGHGEVNPKF